MKIILTYGTFDLLHYGHIRILERAKKMGDYLIVGLSTDAFNALKNKKCVYSFRDRKKILNAIKYVDLVIPEKTWEQKESDILKYKVDILVMGDDWKGKFDQYSNLCDVKYLKRTKVISTTYFKNKIKEKV